MSPTNAPGEVPIVVIGAGFTGLSAAWDLLQAGHRVKIVEAATEVGGLAGSFKVGDVLLEKFYHHWFTNDVHVMALIKDLGLADRVIVRPTNTGMYVTNKFFKLSSPMDVLKFKPLPFLDRIRLGILALRARRVKDWRKLENISAEQWLRDMGGDKVWQVVWEPLMRGKFGDDFFREISAVWMWNKLKLRGGSRGKGGREELAYFQGGFARLATELCERIKALGGEVITGCPVTAIEIVGDGSVRVLTASGQAMPGKAALVTTPLPVAANLLAGSCGQDYAASLRRIRYLSNVCLVLQLDRSLSSTYWLNVNEPDFPYVAVIEHTNFDPPEKYQGRHIVYLSKYLPKNAQLYAMSDDAVLQFSIPHIKKMFPAFDSEWIIAWNVWRADYSQPIVEKSYSALIPSFETPAANVFLATMAQIYPEDRGTNYAIREGRRAASEIVARLH